MYTINKKGAVSKVNSYICYYEAFVEHIIVKQTPVVPTANSTIHCSQGMPSALI